MNGLAKRLAPQIPQGDVDSANRLDISALPTKVAREGVELLPDFDRLIGADICEQRRKYIIDACCDRARWTVLTALAPADQAIVGLDLHQQAVAFRKARLGRIKDLLGDRCAQNECG